MKSSCKRNSEKGDNVKLSFSKISEGKEKKKKGGANVGLYNPHRVWVVEKDQGDTKAGEGNNSKQM